MLDTDIIKINEQVKCMIQDLKANNTCSENDLQNKYNYLYTISKTLFNYIYKEYTQENVSIEQENIIKNILNKMLESISNIQKNKINQNNASEYIGKILANQYAPQYFNYKV